MSDDSYSFTTSDHTEWDDDTWTDDWGIEWGICDECDCYIPIDQLVDYGSFRICLLCLGRKKDE